MAKALQQKKNSKVSQNSGFKFRQIKYSAEWLIFGVAFLLFAYTVGSEYNMDDELVTINHRLTSKGISAIPEIFSSPYYQDESGYSYEYRPLVLTSFAIEHQIFADNPHASHFFNVLLYGLCCLVLLKVLQKLFRNFSPLLPVAITLLFAVHPAHTEVVCSIKNRDEILGLLFALLTLLIILKAIESPRKWWLVLAPLLFTLALMGKMTIICFVIIIPLALILFTEAGLDWVLFITVLLTIPSFILMNLGSGWEKILLFTSVLAVLMVFYTIVNFESFQLTLASSINSIKAALFTILPSPKQTVGIDEGSFDPNNIFKGIEPPRSLFAIGPAILTIGLAISYLLCIALLHSLLGVIPITVLMLLAWRGEERISWWSSIMIAVCLVANVAVSHTMLDNYVMSMYIMPVGMYLVLQLFYGKKTLFIPIFILLIIHISAWKYLKNDIDVLLFFIVVLYNNKYITYIFIVILLFMEIHLRPFSNSNIAIDFITNGIEMVIILCIHFKKGIRIIPWILLIMVLIWFHFNRFNLDQKIHVEKAITTIVNTSNSINPRIVSTPENRPLSYIEDCVDQSTPVAVRVGTSLQIMLHYLCKVIIPYPLSFYYGSKFIYPQKISDTIPLLSLTLYLLLFITAILLLRRERLISFGLLIYLISIATFSNYLQPVPGMFADRFLLIPSLGWAIIFVVIVQKIWRADISIKMTQWSSVPKYARYSFCGVLLIYSGMTFLRNLDWHDDLRLMRHDVKVVPESIQAHNLLGIHLVRASFANADPSEQKLLREEALDHLKTANSLFPGYFNFTYDIGRTYSLLNVPDSALIYFKKAYVINPDFPDVSLNLANICFLRNDFEGSIPYYVQLINLGRADFGVYDKLSYAYFKTNQFESSIKTNEDAIKHFPSQVDPYINIATCYLNNNGHDSAVVWLNRALVLSPSNPAVIDYLKKLGQ